MFLFGRTWKLCQDGDVIFCNDVDSLFKALELQHNPQEWRLFIDSSKVSLKAVLLHNGLMKNFVKAMDCGGSGFQYLNLKFPKVSETKIKEGIFVGPQFRQLMKDPVFESKLTKKEAAAWTLFKELEENFFENHKAEN
ncbi:hypothetical protein AVEN_99097-1 [Araneus ventricosus]|uniref:Uncharacterized protein n=1 Tax=Araneus ventricosus TaxID=182803 RepID=A0A4Y2K3J0_ARAVE|nr:hypothetical protein AVEN_99097-1 [Araneus ventricosus]